MNVIGYVRVSTAEQSLSGLGLESQEAQIRAETAHRGWNLVDLVCDAGYSAKDLHRPGIARVRATLATKGADAVVVAKLDRITRSSLDCSMLLEAGRKEGWTIIAFDLGLDPTTPAGEMMTSVMVAIGQWERRQIGLRTKDALAAAKARGVILGRPKVLSPEVKARIRDLHSKGLTLRQVASILSEDTPTAHGGERWYASSVAAVLRTA